MVLIFPGLGKCSFTPHLLNTSANPNRAYEKRSLRESVPLLWGKHRPDVGGASPCVCTLGNKKSSKGMHNTCNTHLATQQQRRAPSELYP